MVSLKLFGRNRKAAQPPPAARGDTGGTVNHDDDAPPLVDPQRRPDDGVPAPSSSPSFSADTPPEPRPAPTVRIPLDSPPPQLSSSPLDFGSSSWLEPDALLPPPPPQTASRSGGPPSPSSSAPPPPLASASAISLGVYQHPSASRSTLDINGSTTRDRAGQRMRKPSLRDVLAGVSLGRAFSRDRQHSAQSHSQSHSPIEAASAPIDEGADEGTGTRASPVEELASSPEILAPAGAEAVEEERIPEERSMDRSASLAPSPSIRSTARREGADPEPPPPQPAGAGASGASPPATPITGPSPTSPTKPSSSSSFFAKLRRGSAASSNSAPYAPPPRKSSVTSSIKSSSYAIPPPSEPVPPLPAKHAVAPTTTTTTTGKRPGPTALFNTVLRGRRGRSGSVAGSDAGSIAPSECGEREKPGSSFSVRSCHNVRNGSVSSLLLPAAPPPITAPPSGVVPGDESLASPTDIIMSYAYASDSELSPKAARTAPSTKKGFVAISPLASPVKARSMTTTPVASAAAGTNLPGPGPRMSAAAFRQRAAARSSVTSLSLSSSRSDIGGGSDLDSGVGGGGVGGGSNRDDGSPRSSRLKLPYVAGGPGAARSEASLLPSSSRATAAKPVARRTATMPVQTLIGQIPPLEFQGVPGFGRVRNGGSNVGVGKKDDDDDSDDDMPLAPPRPAFYGHRGASSSAGSLSSRGGGSEFGERGRQASSAFGTNSLPTRSASPASSVRSAPPLTSAMKGGRLMMQQQRLQQQQQQGQVRQQKPKLSPSGSSSSNSLVVPALDSGRSSIEGWQTAAGESGSEEEATTGESGSVEELTTTTTAATSEFGVPAAAAVSSSPASLRGTPPQRPATHSRQSSFQSAKSYLIPTPAASPLKLTALLPSPPLTTAAAVGESSGDEDDVPLSRLKGKRSMSSLTGSPARSGRPTPIMTAAPLPASPAASPPASPTKPPSLRSMATANSKIVTADQFWGASEAEAAESRGRLQVAAPLHHGRSMSALSTSSSSGATQSDSTVTNHTERPGPSPIASIASAPAVRTLMPLGGADLATTPTVTVPVAPFSNQRHRGYSPASSSSGSGSGTWSMPLTPRDTLVTGLPSGIPGAAPSVQAGGKPKVTFDPSVVDKEVGRRVGQPLFSGGLGIPSAGRGGPHTRQASFGGTASEAAARPTHGGWRSVSDLRDGMKAGGGGSDDTTDEDESLGQSMQRKAVRPSLSAANLAQATAAATSLRGRGQGAAGPGHGHSASVQAMPPPPGVDPYLFASLPMDQKMQLHQRSQMMMMMAAQAQQAAHMQAMAMSASHSMMGMDNWDTRSALSAAQSVPPMMGYGYPPMMAQHPMAPMGGLHPAMMPWGAGSASAVGLPTIRPSGSTMGVATPAGSSSASGSSPAAAHRDHRLRFQTK